MFQGNVLSCSGYFANQLVLLPGSDSNAVKIKLGASLNARKKIPGVSARLYINGYDMSNSRL